MSNVWLLEAHYFDYSGLTIDNKPMGGDFPVGKSNEFTMDNARRHWEKRPYRYDTIGLDERLDPDVDLTETEHEVDAVSSRKFLHNRYKYAVSFKRWDQVCEDVSDPNRDQHRANHSRTQIELEPSFIVPKNDQI